MDMIATLTLQEKEILCKAAGAGAEGLWGIAHCFELGWKATFSTFLRLFNKNILEQQHAENVAKSAEIDVLELLSLQNVLRSQLGQN